MSGTFSYAGSMLATSCGHPDDQEAAETPPDSPGSQFGANSVDAGSVGPLLAGPV